MLRNYYTLSWMKHMLCFRLSEGNRLKMFQYMEIKEKMKNEHYDRFDSK